MANDSTHLGLLAETGRLSFTSSSQVPLPEMPMAKFSRSYRLTKTFGTQATRCGSLGCDGLNHGVGNETRYGTTCESLTYTLLLINTFPNVSHHSADVNVCLWDLGEYQDDDAAFPAFINPDWIKGHLAMSTVSIGQSRIKVWATIDLAKVRILGMTSDLDSDLCLQ
jgi:hypothetical protein